MRRALVGLAVLAIASMCPARASANDQQIAQSIVGKMKAEQEAGKLHGFRLDLEVEKGVVWLKGTVATPEQEQLCLDIARYAQGVTKVVDAIDVTASPAVSQATATTDASSDEADQQIVQTIVQRVQSRQQLGELSGLAVDLFCKDGVVKLTGDVTSSGDQFELLDIARRVSGVRQVVNAMQVAEPNVMRTASARTPQARPIPARPAVAGLPMPIAPASMSRAQDVVYQDGGMSAPAQLPTAAAGVPASAQYDAPQVPGYAWPTYAAHPNYAGVTYPGQYSASAWPYIGPFYPYPQVPLGWRKVALEWDDGWWYLDFWDK